MIRWAYQVLIYRLNNKIIPLAAPPPPAAHTPVQTSWVFSHTKTQFYNQTNKSSSLSLCKILIWQKELQQSARRRRLPWSPGSSSCPHGLGALPSWTHGRPQCPADGFRTSFNNLFWITVVNQLYLGPWIHAPGHRQIFQLMNNSCG